MMNVETKSIRGKWIEVYGYATAGGDPVWKCSNCGCAEHVYGIEHPNKQIVCSVCGSTNKYPWEQEESE